METLRKIWRADSGQDLGADDSADGRVIALEEVRILHKNRQFCI